MSRLRSLFARITKVFGTKPGSTRLKHSCTLGVVALEDRLTPTAAYATVNDWGSGLQGKVVLTNDENSTLTYWQVSFDYNRSITSLWNAQLVSHIGKVRRRVVFQLTIFAWQTIGYSHTAPGFPFPRIVLLMSAAPSGTPRHGPADLRVDCDMIGRLVR